jgi:glycosyltransferase involved in cell wall biosynthesis
MRVLYASVYRDSTGWGQAARDYILALDAAGIDVVPRPLKLDPQQAKLPDRIRELEAKSSRGCDVVVQHVLPHQMDYNGRMLNVGLYATETSDFKSSAWAERVNAMDRAVVINRQSKAASEASGVTIPVSVVPHACDLTRYQKSYDCPDLLKPHKDRGEFLFYTVGELTQRKNLVALLKAFHLEFHPDEPVGLVVKASRPGLSPAECRRAVEGLCEEVKRGLKLHGGAEHYKQEVVITERVTDHVMLRIHSGCDCFVQPSRGEAWSIPAFDAMAMGRTPIVTACTGYLDYLSDNEGWLVDCREEPVYGVTDTFEDLFCGQETWWEVNVPHLRWCMRQAYEDSRLREDKAANGIARAYDFSYEAVGALLKGALQSDDRDDLAGHAGQGRPEAAGGRP